MAITISGENNNDRILAQDGVIDQISGINIVGLITASHINVGSNINLGNAGIVTATTFVGNLTGNVNSTSPLLLQTGGSERFRITGNNELGIAGANYGSSGQVLTSGGSGSAVTWSTIPTQITISANADNRVITGGSGTNLAAESSFTYNAGSLIVSNASGNVTQQLNATSGDAKIVLDNSGNGNYSAIDFERERSTGAGVNGGSIFMLSDTSSNDAYLYLQAQSASAQAPVTSALADDNGVRLILKGGDGIFSVETGSAERLRINSVGDLLLGNHGSRIFDDSSGTNVVVDIYGGTTAGKRGILALGGRTGSDDADIGTIQFVNENNNLATAANHNQSKLVSSIHVKSETSDGNAGSDSGGHLIFSTKPETGQLTERLRIESSGAMRLKSEYLRFQAGDHQVSDFSQKVGLKWTYETDIEIAKIEVSRPSWSGGPSDMLFHTCNTSGQVNERLRISSDGKVGIGTADPDSHLTVKKGASTGISLIPVDDTDEFQINFNNVGGSTRGFITYEFNNDALKIRTGGTGEALRITSTRGVIFKGGPLQEKVKITAGKLSDNTTIDLADGNVHYFTTQESTTSTPNLRVNSTTTLDSVMAVGETIAVTIITTAVAGGYSDQLQIDGSNVTENWVGGSAPTAGGGSGVDIYNYTIIKTAANTYTVIANLTKTS